VVALPEGTVPALVCERLWRRANEALDRGKAGRPVRYRPEDDPGDVLVRGHAVCAHCGRRLVIHRYADGPYLFCQTRQRDRTACPGCTIKASILDQETWRRVTWILSDPAVVIADAEREQHQGRLAADMVELNRLLRDAKAREESFADALGLALTGPALATAVAKLNGASAYRAGLEARRAEVEAQVILLERRQAEFRDWAELMMETLDDLQTMPYAARRERLRRLDVAITVAKPGSDRPHYEIVMGLVAAAGRSVRLQPDAVGNDRCAAALSRYGCAAVTPRPTGHDTPVPCIWQYPYGTLCRYCWW
jgi:hypothetical protein